MTTVTFKELDEQIEKHGKGVSQDNETARELQRLKEKLLNLLSERTSLEARRERFAAIGDGHYRLPYAQYVPSLGNIEFEGMKSIHTGNELAAKIQHERIDHVDIQIGIVEAHIQELLEK